MKLMKVRDLYPITESSLTDEQKKKMEEIVLSLKDQEEYFKNKYGDEWESVMYAVATKRAKASK